MWQDSRAVDGHRFLQCGTPAQAEGNEADQQADGRTPSRRSKECTGPELQGVEATGKLYRESCREKTNRWWRQRRSWGLAHHMSFDWAYPSRRPLPLMGQNRLIYSFIYIRGEPKLLLQKKYGRYRMLIQTFFINKCVCYLTPLRCYTCFVVHYLVVTTIQSRVSVLALWVFTFQWNYLRVSCSYPLAQELWRGKVKQQIQLSG